MKPHLRGLRKHIPVMISIANKPQAAALALSLFSLPALPAAAAPPTTNTSGPIATANQLGVAFSRVAEQVSPSVVSIKVEARRPVPSGQFFFPFGGAPEQFTRGGGSGVIVTADGAILTNHHVVEHASRIEVQLRDGRSFRAEVAGRDPDTDLALLRIKAKGLKAARFADSDHTKVGQWVVAIGSPFGLDYTVTAGVLSAKGRGQLGANKIEDYLQTDASINPGNSGGPLVNLRGEVVGINTMIIGRATGIGFAIPSNLAERVAKQLNKSGAVRRAWIGVSFQELTAELASSFGAKGKRGALVNGVVRGGPADRAGVQEGDIIVKVGNSQVSEGRDLLRAVLRHDVGKKVVVSVVRQGKPVDLTITTGARPSSDSKPRVGSAGGSKGAGQVAGMRLSKLSSQRARRMGYSGNGVLITGVAPGSAADRAGIIEGDIIQEVQRRAATSPAQVNKALKKKRVLLKIFRQGGSLYRMLQQ